MASNEFNMAALVAQLPDADSPGQESTFTGPEPGQAAPLFEQVLAGGPGALAELITLIRAPGDPEFRDFRAEYLLHALAVYVTAPRRPASVRRMFAETLAAQIGSGALSSEVRALLVRELVVAGGPEVVGALAPLLSDPELGPVVATALGAIAYGAVAPLRKALSTATGACRRSVVQALGVLADPGAAGELSALLADDDPAVRETAAWALARIGRVEAFEAVLALADRETGFSRIKATQACLLLAENLRARGDAAGAARIYRHLAETRTDPAEAYVRELARKEAGM